MNFRYGPLREILEAILLALIVFVLVREAVQNFRVEGASMLPTLESGEFVLVDKISYSELQLGPFSALIPGRENGDYLFSSPARGDLVVFQPPNDQFRDYVKRVIGLPGDIIEVRDGSVVVNGDLLEETAYTLTALPYQWDPVLIPQDHYFVMGDNRQNSVDSISFGPIHKNLIIGKVIFRWFPVGKIGSIGGRELFSENGVEIP